ncbi:MAG: hypothetical protein ACR2PB_01010 [Desulfocapsaceae bacterium]
MDVKAEMTRQNAGGPTDYDELVMNFKREYEGMQSWQNSVGEQGNDSASGVSGLTPDEISDLFFNLISGKIEGPTVEGNLLSEILCLALEDLRSCYLKGRAAQPAQATASSTIMDWFWGETHAAQLLNEVRKSCLHYREQDMLATTRALIVPMNQQYRFNA